MKKRLAPGIEYAEYEDERSQRKEESRIAAQSAQAFEDTRTEGPRGNERAESRDRYAR
jgi:hypothetical protein